MDYVKGIFKNRPNRFIAEVEVDGNLEIAHVPNTGRCKELLVDDAIVWLKPSDNTKRKIRHASVSSVIFTTFYIFHYNK